jgi:hypothetical protein
MEFLQISRMSLSAGGLSEPCRESRAIHFDC